MSVASLMRSAVGNVSSGVTAAAAGVAASRERWADVDDDHIGYIQFETVNKSDADSDVEEVVAEVRPAPSISGGSEDSAVAAGQRGGRVEGTVEGAWFSAGSEKHTLGACKPCAFFHEPEGCQNGAECQFCHRCPPREKQRRKRVHRRLLREHELRAAGGYGHGGSRRFGHSRQGSTTSTGTASTWESDSTVDSAGCPIACGPPSRQSSGSVDGSPMMPLGYVQAMVPVYAVPSGGPQSVDPVPKGGAAGGLGYEFRPELHVGQGFAEVVVATAGAPGTPTAYACATPFPQEVDSVVVESEPVADAAPQPCPVACGAYAPLASYTLVPVDCSMHMPQHLRQLPMVHQQLPQQASFFAPVQLQPATFAATSASVWRAPVCHASGDAAVACMEISNGWHVAAPSSHPGMASGMW